MDNCKVVETFYDKIKDSYELNNNVIYSIPEPLVSVRTSTYNQAAFITQCIEGVLMQKTTFPVEYIIGEDCSTDETRAIVFEYGKKYPDRIRVITADYNVGSKANSRRSILACRGKYIAICEGDDYWTDPYKLQKQVDFLEAHPDYGMSYMKAKVFFNETGKFGVRNWGSDYKNFEYFLLHVCMIPTLCVCQRRHMVLDYITDIKPEERDWMLGDYPQWLWFAYHSNIHFLDEVGGVYRHLKKSACHSDKYIYRLNFKKSVMNIRLFLADHFNTNELKERILNVSYSEQSEVALKYNERKEFRYYLSIIANKTLFQNIEFFLSGNIVTYQLFRLIVKIYLRIRNVPF